MSHVQELKFIFEVARTKWHAFMMNDIYTVNIYGINLKNYNPKQYYTLL